MLSLETFSYENATWDAVFEGALVLNDAFRNDFLRTEFWPAKYNFSKLPRNVGYDRLLEYPAFNIASHYSARLLYTSLRSNPRYRLVLFRDSTSKDLVGMSTVILPNYIEVKTPSLFYKLKTVLLSVVYKIKQWWAFGQFSNPLSPPAVQRLFHEEAVKCDVLPTPARISHLAKLSPKELAETTYPKQMSYYINLFALKSDLHGSGVGSQMMKQLIESIKNAELGPFFEPNAGGPAKAELFSAPAAINFYKRCGFSVGFQFEDKQPSGRMLTHTFFYMNLT